MIVSWRTFSKDDADIREIFISGKSDPNLFQSVQRCLRFIFLGSGQRRLTAWTNGTGITSLMVEKSLCTWNTTLASRYSPRLVQMRTQTPPSCWRRHTACFPAVTRNFKFEVQQEYPPNKAFQRDKVAMSHLLQRAQKLRHANFGPEQWRYAASRSPL